MAALADKKGFFSAYEQQRFLDAYRPLAPYLKRGSAVDLADADDCIQLSRLSVRLGGNSLAKEFMERALEIAPNDPEVRYYSLCMGPSVSSLLGFLERLEIDPGLEGGSPEQRSSWKAMGALAYAGIRDFGKADEWLAEADRAEAGSWYVESCRAAVLLAEGKWNSAFDSAMETLKRRPGYYAAMSVLRSSSFKLGRFAEAARTILDPGLGIQSYESSVERHLTQALAEERFPGLIDELGPGFRRPWAERAIEEALLADDECAATLSLLEADAAIAAGDYERLREIPLPREHPLVEALKKTTRNRRSIIDHPALPQRYNACLPTSVATVLGALGMDIELDAFVDSVTGGAGTEFLDAREWLRGLGIECVFFRVGRSNAEKLISARIPFVCSVWTEAGGHSMAAIGFDPAVDVLTLHDPSGERYVRFILSGADQGGSGFELLGMAFRGEGLPDPLPLLDPLDIDEIETWLSFLKALELSGPTKAREILAASELSSDSDRAIRMKARLDLLSGDHASAIRDLEALKERRPEYFELKLDLFEARQSGPDAADRMASVDAMLRDDRSPGTTLSKPWDYVPAPLLVRCAELKSKTDGDLRYPEEVIGEVIKRIPTFAPAYAALARMRSAKGLVPESRLPARIAAFLAPESPECAWIAFDTLRQLDGTSTAAGWLAGRCLDSAEKKDSHKLLLMAKDVLKAYGCEAEYRTVMGLIEAKASEEGECLAAIALDRAERGEFEEAYGMADSLDASGHRLLALKARVGTAGFQGTLAERAADLEAWMAEEPQNAEALTLYSRIVERRDGIGAAERLLEAAMERFPLNDGIRDLYYRCITRCRSGERVMEFLESEARDDPWDAWVYREIALLKLAESARVDSSAADRLVDEAEGWLRAVREFDPAAIANGVVEARLAAIRGDIDGAKTALFASVERNPEMGAVYGEFANLLGDMALDERLVILLTLAEKARSERGSIDSMLTVCSLAKRFLGTAQAMALFRDSLPRQAVLNPKCLAFLLDFGEGQREPDETMEAVLDGAGEWGESRLDAVRARLLMQAGREKAASSLLERRLRAMPTDLQARLLLIGILERSGDRTGASRLIDECLGLSSTDAAAAVQLGRTAAAIGFTRRARNIALTLLASNPLERDALELLETSNARFRLQGETFGYVDRAASADSGDPALALARIRCREAMKAAGQAEAIEAEYADAMARWPRFYPIIDARASVLASRGDHDGALALLGRRIGSTDEVLACGRRAVVEWMGNDRRKAAKGLAAALERHPEYDWGWDIMMSMLAAEEDSDQAELVQRLADRFLETPSRMAALLKQPKGKRLADEAGIDLAAFADAHRGNPNAIALAARFLAMEGDAPAGPWDSLETRFPSHPGSIARRYASHVPADAEKAAEDLHGLWALSQAVRADFEPSVWSMRKDDGRQAILLGEFFKRLASGEADELSIGLYLDNAESFPVGAFPVPVSFSAHDRALAALKACPGGGNGPLCAAAIAWWMEDHNGTDDAFREISGSKWELVPGSALWRRFIFEAAQKKEYPKIQVAFAGYSGGEGSSMGDGWNMLISLGAASDAGIPESAEAAERVIEWSNRALEAWEPDGCLPAIVYTAAAALLKLRRYDEYRNLAARYGALFDSAEQDFWLPEAIAWMRTWVPIYSEILRSPEGQAERLAEGAMKKARSEAAGAAIRSIIVQTAASRGRVGFLTRLRSVLPLSRVYGAAPANGGTATRTQVRAAGSQTPISVPAIVALVILLGLLRTCIGGF